MTEPVTDLRELAALVPGATLVIPDQSPLSGGPEAAVHGIAYNSRRVGPGDLFFCVRGFRTDGIRFLPDALVRGAAAAVVEGDLALAVEIPVPVLRVPDVRQAMAVLAAAFYGNPSRRLALAGVTGTNGKTTSTYLIETLARAAGRATGVIGTIETRINAQVIPGDRTTPEAPDLQALLAQMADTAAAGAAPEVAPVVAMEVSSHALVLERTLGCEFDVAVFTNLTQDHLDFHGSMEEYFLAKARLFTEYPQRAANSKPFCGVINVDDPFGQRLAAMTEGNVLRYGVHEPADLRALDVRATPRGVSFRLAAPEGTFPVQLRLGGLFNVYNTLGAVGAARALEIAWETILPALESAATVPGRFESVEAGQDYSVIVDYAHTPDGLENVLRAARALHPKRLIVVFGCGGDRDRTKRPIMGRIATELADVAVITSDNPRSEDPDAIVQEIVAGVPAASMAKTITQTDRRIAINQAIGIAEPGDLVVLAGKGHEPYQVFSHETIHFDDREEARNAIHARLSA